jgi:heme/copper-type cytochrome/quinol oxidase subunit 3
MAQDVVNSVMEKTDDTLEKLRTLPAGPPFGPRPPQGPDDGEPHGDDDDAGGAPISNARLGMMMFLGAETMFFAGLVGSFLVFRFAHATWPPPTFPQLPIVVTGINTLFLLYSAITMWQAQQLMRDDMRQQSVRMLGYTAILGILFLVIQGYEWLKLIGFGLTLTSGVYGATFYTLIGCHGLHVLGAVVWLLMVLWRAKHGRYSARRYTGLAICGMYWYYVVGLWPVLYWLVYLY